MTFFLGIEGPVLAGKSTTAATLAARLRKREINCVVLPDFVDAARQLNLRLPALDPSDVTHQIAAVEFYLKIDGHRRLAVRNAEVALVDRTCWTLLAHTAALAEVGRVNALVEVQQVVWQANLFPTRLLYLDIPHSEQLRRVPNRGTLPPPLLDRLFNNAFRAYFHLVRDSQEVHWIDACANVVAVATNAEAYLLAALAQRPPAE